MKDIKVLKTAPAIRNAINHVLGDPTDTRIVIVGFVGIDGPHFLPSPKGIKLYCWPKAGGTHPDAIRALLAKEVSVNFVDNLHAKLYWSKKRGAVIGSANLTSNALGGEGLHEVAVQFPRGVINASTIASGLDVNADLPATLARLQTEHNAFYQRNPVVRYDGKKRGGKKKTKSANMRLRSFLQWRNLEAICAAQTTCGPTWRRRSSRGVFSPDPESQPYSTFYGGRGPGNSCPFAQGVGLWRSALVVGAADRQGDRVGRPCARVWGC